VWATRSTLEAENLSPEYQQMFNKALRETRLDARQLIKSGQDSRAEVRELLDAPEFDRGAILIALSHACEADMGLCLGVKASLVDFAASLTPEEREKLVSGLARQGALRQGTLALALPLQR